MKKFSNVNTDRVQYSSISCHFHPPRLSAQKAQSSQRAQSSKKAQSPLKTDSARLAHLLKTPEKTKSAKGQTNQAERSRARKLKRRQEIQADLDAKRRNTPAKSLATPQ